MAFTITNPFLRTSPTEFATTTASGDTLTITNTEMGDAFTVGTTVRVADFADNGCATTYSITNTTITTGTCYVDENGKYTYFKIRTDPLTGLDQMVPCYD